MCIDTYMLCSIEKTRKNGVALKLALSHAILVCLTDRPMSGYDLAKFFDTSVGFFWKATHPQIYRELKKLQEQGHVSSIEEVQSGKPNRIAYSITESGKDALKEWSRKPVSLPNVKDDLLVRLQAIEYVDKAALKQQIAARLEAHREQLGQYHHIRDVRFSDGDPPARDLGKLMGLELGIEYEKGWIAWCEKVLKRLDAG